MGLTWISIGLGFRVKKLGDHDVQMICSKQKDAPEFKTMQFIAVSTLDSIILEKTETRKANAKNKLTADQKLALECLQELIEANTATNGNVAGKNVHLDKWRHEFKRRHTGDNDKSKNLPHPPPMEHVEDVERLSKYGLGSV